MCLAENLCFDGENEVEVLCDEELGHPDDHIDNERGFSWTKEEATKSLLEGCISKNERNQMKAGDAPTKQAKIKREATGGTRDIGTRVRNLHNDYKKALAMAMAGKTDAEIVEAIKVDGIGEAELQKNMAWLLGHLRVDSFDSPVLQSRPVRRALKNFWVHDFGPE